MIVKALQEVFHLTKGKLYTVVGIEDCTVRIVNDRGEPILYPKFLFEVIDDTVPPDWKVVEDVEFPPFNIPISSTNPPRFNYDFYKSWFNGDEKTRETFTNFYQSLING